MTSSGLFTTVLVGSDGSESAAQAIRIAANTVGAGGTLEIIGACGNAAEQAALEPKLAAEAAALAERGITSGSRVLIGDPVEVILEAAVSLGSDLIVLGNKGMTGARRFILGSVPDKVSHRAECSVMIARTTSGRRRRAAVSAARPSR